VVAIDQHIDHIKGHRKVIADHEDRMDPELVQRTLAHINEHIQALSTTNPSLLNILEMAPIAPPSAPPTPPQGANAPQPNANPNQVQAPPGTPPEVAEHMPSMPQGAPQ